MSNGRADYDSLQVRMQKRMSDGLAYTVAYTWSQAQGDFLDHLSAGGGATGNFPQDAYNMAADYGALAFDIPHRLVASFIYELPFGEGTALRQRRRGRGDPRRLGGERHPHLERRPAVHDHRRGHRRHRHGPDQRAPTASATRCPTASTRRSTRGSTSTPSRPPVGRTYGNCENNSVRGPGSKSMNLSLFRSIVLGGDKRLELRVETFNLFNWVNYGFPAANVGNPATFGRITTTLGDPREMQLAVKFYF